VVALARTVINVEPAGWEEASCGQRHISWKGWIRLIGVGCSMWLVRRARVALGKGLLGSDKPRQIRLPLPHRDCSGVPSTQRDLHLHHMLQQHDIERCIRHARRPIILWCCVCMNPIYLPVVPAGVPLKGRHPRHAATHYLDARPHPIWRPKHSFLCLCCGTTTDTQHSQTHQIGSLKFGFFGGTRRHQNREYHHSHRLAHHIPRPHQNAARSGTKTGPLCDHPRDARLLRCIYVAHHLSFIRRASWKRFPSWLPRYHGKSRLRASEPTSRLPVPTYTSPKTPSRPWPENQPSDDAIAKSVSRQYYPGRGPISAASLLPGRTPAIIINRVFMA
jgi:hypothetical protein